MKPVQLFCWHFMAYPYLDKDFDEKQYSGVGHGAQQLWDNRKARGLYQEYIDQLAYADELGFDGMVLNEHHQNIYGSMPSPNLIASALTQRTTRGGVILGNLLPLHNEPSCAWPRSTPCSINEQRPLDCRLRPRRRPRNF